MLLFGLGGISKVKLSIRGDVVGLPPESNSSRDGNRSAMLRCLC